MSSEHAEHDGADEGERRVDENDFEFRGEAHGYLPSEDCSLIRSSCVRTSNVFDSPMEQRVGPEKDSGAELIATQRR